MMACYGGEVCHADVTSPAFVNERQARDSFVIIGILRTHLVKEATIDFVNDLQVAREQVREEPDRPLLQGLRQQGMICVGDRATGDMPGAIPPKPVFVDQQAHQFSYGDCRMRVVKLDRELLVEVFRLTSSYPMHAEHILQGTGHKEDLLLEPEHFPLRRLVVRIEDLCDIFRLHFLLDRAVVVALVERGEIKRFDRLSLPEPKQIAGADPVTQDGSVVRLALDDAVRDPARPMMALVVYPWFSVPSKTNVVDDLGPADFPWITETQPFIGRLDLPTFLNRLFEDSEFVPDTVTDRRYLKRSQRIHVTGREPAQSAVSKTGLLLLLNQGVKVVTEFDQRLTRLIRDAEVEQIECKMGARKIFRRKIGYSPGLLFAVTFQCLYAMPKHPIPHRQCQRCVKIVLCCDSRHPAHAVKKIVDQ